MSAPSRGRAVLALAGKDLRLLLRNRGAMFFAFVWPVLMALFFGVIFGGGGARGRIPVALVDEDRTAGSAKLVERLGAASGLEVSCASREEAERLVRQGKRAAAVIIPPGSGAASQRLFHGAPRQLEIAVDPARTAEAAMLEGMLLGAAMQSMQDLFTRSDASRSMVDGALADLRTAPEGPDRTATERLLGELRTWLDREPAPRRGAASGDAPASGAWQPVVIARRELREDRAGPRNAFEITFPQGILWGVIGASLGFALSLVTERTRGTLTRLRTAPISRGDVLAGKALACFATIVAVEALLLALGGAFFGVRPSSLPLLALAGLSLAFCFVGLMMLVSVLGKNEQSAGGLGWAIMLPMAMFGGGMVPLFIMPTWMQAVSNLSPVKWGILALEGAVWRGFGLAEMLVPVAVLLAVGAAGLLVGARVFGREG
jgi:ABC-2 type transport system permease protein